MSTMRAVSNTSPLFHLAFLDLLDLLDRQFDEILIPDAVAVELEPVRDHPAGRAFWEALDLGRLTVRSVQDRRRVRLLQADLDLGESEAIALAIELDLDRVLIDERDGRAAARDLGLQPIGVLGILLRAKKTGTLQISIRDAMTRLREEAGFFIHARLFQQILEEAGEARTDG